MRKYASIQKEYGQAVSWSNPEAPVTVSISYAPSEEELLSPEHIVIWYIDGQGNAISVPSGRYDSVTGRVTFQTTHFSDFAVAYVEKTFGDLSGVEWARNAIETMASKGIVKGTSENIYTPNANISRGDFLILLTKTLGLESDVTENFSDVLPGQYYYEAIGIGKKLGIATGTGNNVFKPKDSISRQDMFVMTEKALKIKGRIEPTGNLASLEAFSDNAAVSNYAKGSITNLLSEGLVSGFAGKINPRANTTRAEAAVFLYRIY